ncbi:YjcZ family sporulation protein [Virgibacillus sp. DJP39]
MGFAYGYPQGGQNGFILLVVLFVLLVIIGNNYPTGDGGY